MRTPARRRRATVKKVVELLLLIRTEHGADCGEQVALFLVEAVACLAVDLFEAVAALFEQLPDLIALCCVELNFARQAFEELRWERRTAGSAAEASRSGPRTRAPATEAVRAGTIGRSWGPRQREA